MKKYIINLLMLLVAGAFVLTSCDTDNKGTIYVPDSVGATFYWAKKSISLNAANMSFELELARNTTKGEAVVQLVSIDNSGLFSIPSSVTFADGKGTATFAITAGDLVVGKNYPVTLSIADESASVSAVKTIALSVLKEYNWESYGTGQWTDGIVMTMFNISRLTYNVQVEKAVGEEVYRVVNPYGLGVFSYTKADNVTKNPCYLVINATVPNAVTVASQGMGIDYGYGEFETGSIYGNMSTNITAYPLGVKTGKTIDLGAIYVAMGEEGPYPCADSTILVLP